MDRRFGADHERAHRRSDRPAWPGASRGTSPVALGGEHV